MSKDANEEEEEPSGFAGFISSIFTPGVSPIQIRALNISFIGLILFLFLIVVVIGSDAGIHMYFFLFMAIGLFGSIQWFFGQIKAKEE